MALDPDHFRSVLGRFASGVTVVTARDSAGQDHGMTVSAFASLSLEPPLLLICVDRSASMFGVLSTTPWFAVNILASHQEALARRFANIDAGQRFDGIGFARGTHGAPLLYDVCARLECEMSGRHDGGDHGIFIGTVEEAETWEARPLLYYRGGYAELER